MDNVEISAEPRTTSGKGAARRLRAAGRIPAVLYGTGKPAALLSVPNIDFERRVATLEGAHLVGLTGLEGGTRTVLVKEVQEHPVSGQVLHADFLEVDLTKRIRVTVAIHPVGRPVGVVTGGILQVVLREVEVECLPTQIPEFIEVDVTPLEIHASLHVSDLFLPEGVSVVTDTAQTVVTVAAPAAEAEPEEVEGEAADEAEAGTAPDGEATESTETKSEEGGDE